MELSVIGINHKTAPVDVRERFALPGELAGRLLRTLHREDAFSEALVVDTCNRTEIYFVSRREGEDLGYLLGHIAALKGLAPGDADRSAFYRYDGREAVAHLFHVAASLDSQIVGEHQILGQLKDAYGQALDARSAGFLLNKLFHRAFRVGKKVQTETQLGQGATSVSLAAVELARHVFSELAGKTVMLVGAGRTAELAARALVRRGAGRLVVANRTPARAEALAAALLSGKRDKDEVTCPALPSEAVKEATSQNGRLTVETMDLAGISEAITEVDLVISSTGSDQAVLTHEALGERLAHSGRNLFIIDIAVPRDVDVRLGELDNVFLTNIDDLDALVAQNLERRRREIPRAEAIVADEVEQWVDARQAVSTIKLLRERFEGLRQAEVRRYGSRFAGSDREELEKFTAALCNKILHHPMSFLGKLQSDGSPSEILETMDVIHRMFDLDAPDQRT